MIRRDQAIQASYAQAEADHARDRELRALVASNPGRWPKLEKDGIRIQDIRNLEGGRRGVELGLAPSTSAFRNLVMQGAIAPEKLLDALEKDAP